MMQLELFQEVALGCDLPEHGLKQGDIATLIDFAPSTDGKEQGCVLEVFDALGSTVAVVVIPAEHVKPLHAGEILAVRQLAHAS